MVAPNQNWGPRNVENLARAMRTYDLPIGTNVPRSRLVRSYCPMCAAAIRVYPARARMLPVCEDCCPSRETRPYRIPSAWLTETQPWFVDDEDPSAD